MSSTFLRSKSMVLASLKSNSDVKLLAFYYLLRNFADQNFNTMLVPDYLIKAYGFVNKIDFDILELKKSSYSFDNYNHKVLQSLTKKWFIETAIFSISSTFYNLIRSCLYFSDQGSSLMPIIRQLENDESGRRKKLGIFLMQNLDKSILQAIEKRNVERLTMEYSIFANSETTTINNKLMTVFAAALAHAMDYGTNKFSINLIVQPFINLDANALKFLCTLYKFGLLIAILDKMRIPPYAIFHLDWSNDILPKIRDIYNRPEIYKQKQMINHLNVSSITERIVRNYDRAVMSNLPYLDVNILIIGLLYPEVVNVLMLDKAITSNEGYKINDIFTAYLLI